MGLMMDDPIKLSRRGLIGAAVGTALAGDSIANSAKGATSRSLGQAGLTVDVVVIGAGAAGLPAAIAAREAGASVVVLEAESHVGGHGICSGGNVALGGGTSLQKKYGIDDSPDRLFNELTDWSVVGPNGSADYRYNDREIIRAFAMHSALAFEWLVAHGVIFADRKPDMLGYSIGNTPRVSHAAPMDWPMVRTAGRPAPAGAGRLMSSGDGLIRPLEAAAHRVGVRFLLRHRMTGLIREYGKKGRVTTVEALSGDRPIKINVRKAVIIATGGSTGNVEFRRMFDPRLTEEYCGLAGMPWSNQDASGEIAALEVGASLWGLANQSGEFGLHVTKAGNIGCQYGYHRLQWLPGSEVFDKARASGLIVKDWQDVILVNMIGRRFYDETADPDGAQLYAPVSPYVPQNFRNVSSVHYRPNNFINAALAGIGDGHNGGGPIWAIFDADAVAREGWTPTPPHVDADAGFFFEANSLAELASKIVMPHQRVPMPPSELEATVARYNGFVAAGRDGDFDKPSPQYAIRKPPFYAAWSTPVLHDTRAGLRINADCQVIDMSGKVIEGLYCAGESAGGFSMHGLARAVCQGYISGHHAMA